MKTLLLSAALCGSALATGPAQAQVTINTTQLRNDVFAVSAGDLLQTQLAGSSFTGNFTKGLATLGSAAFNNGAFGTVGFQAAGGEAALADGSNTATFTLAGGSTGVDIGRIDSYAGWDGNRGGQAYVLSYSTAADPGAFITLATVFFNATTQGGNTSTRVSIGSSSGLLASQVHSLRFSFSDGLDFGYAAYREIDVFAAAPVPEPASALLMALGAAALLARRRSRPA